MALCAFEPRTVRAEPEAALRGVARPAGAHVARRALCRGGFADCVEHDGARAWGACEGEVLPGAEICDNGLDDDCDGLIDETPAGLPCPTLRTCGEEVCGNGLDDDCDGFADEGCAATGGRQSCWTGAPSQRGVGACEMR